MIDYHTGIPLVGRQYLGRAIVPLNAAISVERERSMQTARFADIEIGDKAKLYGFERSDSSVMTVFRMEDRRRQ